MEIQLKEPIKNMHEIVPLVAHLFPGYQIVVPPLNKKRLMIWKTEEKAAIVLILKNQGSGFVVKSEPNMKNMGLMITLVFGVLCSPLGIIIAMIIIYGMNGDGRRAKAAEAYEILKNEFA